MRIAVTLAGWMPAIGLAVVCGCGGERAANTSDAAPEGGAVDDGATSRADALGPVFVCTPQPGAAVRPGAGFVTAGGADAAALAGPFGLRADGGFLAHGVLQGLPSRVYRYAADGAATQIFSDDGGSFGSVAVSPSGDGFYGFPSIYDDTGNLTGTIPLPAGDGGTGLRLRALSEAYTPSGQDLLVAWGTETPDREVVLEYDLFDRFARRVASWPASRDLARAAATGDALVSLTSTGLTRYALDGGAEWTVPLGNALDFALSADGRAAMVMRSQGAITFVQNGAVAASATIDSPYWNFVITGSGARAAVSMVQPGRIAMFDTGVLVRTVDVALTFVESIATDDQGDVAYGGQVAPTESATVVGLLTADGATAFECAGPIDDAAGRPYVQLAEDGSALTVVWRSAVQYIPLLR